MRKIYKSIYLILVFCVIIFKRVEIKYLSKYIFKYLYYLSINRNLFNSKLNLSNNTKLYRKIFDTKISVIVDLDFNSNGLACSILILESSRFPSLTEWDERRMRVERSI